MKTKLFLLLTPILLSCFALLPVVRAAPSPSNVNVVNTPNVNVVNTTASPVPIRDVDNPAIQPFQDQLDFTLDDGVVETCSSFPDVPTGRRLVIEYASAIATLPAGTRSPRSSIPTSICARRGRSTRKISSPGRPPPRRGGSAR